MKIEQVYFPGAPQPQLPQGNGNSNWIIVGFIAGTLAFIGLIYWVCKWLTKDEEER